MPLGALLLACVAALILNLIGIHRERRGLVVVTKVIASTMFVLVALLGDGLGEDWGRALAVGLAFGWIGDVCLLGKGREWLTAGLGAFLLGHVAYSVAFALHGVDIAVVMLALVLLSFPAFVLDRWLRPHVPSELRVPVRLYIVAISVMLALALAAWRSGAPASVFIGALAFYASDVSVARERFVTKQFVNRLWGLPAYYLGQLLLALSLAGP